MDEDKKIPAIMVGFDPETQSAHLSFDPAAFKTWDFVAAVLEMARKQAEQSGRVAQAQAMQEQAQAQALAHKLNGRLIR